MSLACVGSTCSVPATLGLPPLAACVLPRLHCSGSRLLYRERALSCVYFPGLSHSGSGFRVFRKDQTQLGLRFVPSWVGAGQAAGSLTSALSPGAVHLIPSRGPSLIFQACPSGAPCVPFGKLISDCNPWRMSTIQNLRNSLVRSWKPVCSLVGGAVSGAEFAPLPSPLPPASGRGWAGLQTAALLWYSLSPLF